MTRTRLDPTARHEQLLDAAMRLAVLGNYQHVRWGEIAAAAEVSRSLVRKSLGPTLQDLQDAVMRRAVETRHLGIILQGLGAKHPVARGAPRELRAAAAATV